MWLVCAWQVRVQDVDFNLLSFSQQVAVDLASDVMVGPHGAGLMHNIFMRDRAALIELFVDGSANNRHFHNLAAWFGRHYEGISISNPIDVPELLAAVETAVKKIDVNAY
jgi:capsular polysaccharide biosynthesis protein